MTTISWDFSAILVLFVGCVLVAFITSILTKWALIRFTVELEYRVDSLEDRIGSEVKKRAQEKSVESRKGKDDLVEWAQNAKAESTPGEQPLKPFDEWRRKKMAGKA